MALPAKDTVMVMTAPGPGPDLYQLLGVTRDASRDEIAQAWRRRARTEHPDSRPGDAAAADRFRALAAAWQVLSDPSRRAAYDRRLGHRHANAAPSIRVTHLAGGTPRTGTPLRAGPVLVERPHRAQAPSRQEQEEVRLAILTGLVLRYLAWDWDQPW